MARNRNIDEEKAFKDDSLGGRKQQKKRTRMSITKIILKIGTVVAAFTFFMVFIPKPFYTVGYRNLTELKQFSATLDEWIKMENDNVLFPSYENYYKEKFSTSLSKRFLAKARWILTKLRLRRPPVFSESFFKFVLERVSSYRKDQGWQSPLIQKFEVKPTSKIVVFGVVQGAFHSMVRYLEQLVKLDVIDQDFKLKSPDYFIVFLGNVVNRSPYTLEIFSLVLRLMQQNPDNVVWLRGTNEFFDYWKDHTLRRELELRCKPFSSSAIPLADQVNAFFDTLPATVYATIPYLSTSNELNFFKMVPSIADKQLLHMLDEQIYANFLIKSNKHILDGWQLGGKTTYGNQGLKKKLSMRAIIKDTSKREQYERSEGLMLLSPEKGVVSWTILSSPIEIVRRNFDFFYDSFVVISPNQEISNWTMKHYKRHVEVEGPIAFKMRNYLFFEGGKK